MALSTRSQTATQALYAATCDAEYGTLFPYEGLHEITGIDCRRHRQSIYATMRRLEETASRTLVNVLRQGYRVALPVEHFGLAHGHHGKATQSLQRARRVAKATDRSAFTSEQCKRLDALESTLAWHQETLGRLDQRTQRIEARQLSISTDVQAQLDALAAEVRRLGAPQS